MAISNYTSAIIGLDAQFENKSGVQQDIDRVERALYLGKEQGNEQLSASEITLNDCYKAVARMASANQVNSSDIKVVLVTQNIADQASIETTNVGNILVVTSLAKALIQIDLLIAQNNIVALVGVNLEDHLSELLADKGLSDSATISFDNSFTGYQPCYGVAALLFSSVNFAQANSSYVYSWIKGFAVGDDIHLTTQSAIQNADVNPLDIGLVEVSALADDKLAETESSALISSYGNEDKLSTAITSARSVTGGRERFLSSIRTAAYSHRSATTLYSCYQ